MKRVYGFGLDIGIGSVGWAVISEDEKGENGRIENFGSRIFESGELDNMGKDRKSQERRGFRGVRRNERRRISRKEILKNYLKYVKLVRDEELREAVETPKAEMTELKCRALTERADAKDIVRILLHCCNHRGYQDFYEGEALPETDADASEAEKKEAEDERKTKEAVANFETRFKASGERFVSPFLLKTCTDAETGRVAFRNRSYKEQDRMVIPRGRIREEAAEILAVQAKYFPDALREENRKWILEIIFRQRAFEDGPGDPNDSFRRYKGFLESIGMCRFYPEEKRGFRNTALADLYAAVNAFSQYHYVDEDTGETGLPGAAAEMLLRYVLENGSITRNQAEKELAKLGIRLMGSKDSDDTLKKSFRYLRVIKKAAEEADLAWAPMLEEAGAQTDIERPSFLNLLGNCLSSYQTPRYRDEKLREVWDEAERRNIPTNEAFRKAMRGRKMSGTSSVSDRYMAEAVDAFRKGDLYGNFQWGKESDARAARDAVRTRLLAPSVLADEDLKDNPVVFRSINETRKIVNMLIRTYGSPAYINVEVADDVARSYIERRRIKKMQDDNKKANEKTRREIADLLGIDAGEVKGSQIERFKLYNMQDGKCFYSGKDLGDLAEVLRDSSHRFEVDHIVPYSLILDNTLHNKVLVLGSENQAKGQQTPLMYLKNNKPKKEEFLARVSVAYRKNEISRRKYQYLMLESIYGDKAQELLRGWKSRNINDTRYITKYVVGLLKDHLAGSPKVYGIRGHITSRFRREWLNSGTWGSEEKNRATYLNHAADAVIIANLTPDAVAFAMNYEKLQQTYRHYGRSTTSIQYQRVLDSGVKQLHAFHHMDEDRARDLLQDRKRIPAKIPDLRNEVELRFGSLEGDTRAKEDFDRLVEAYYSGTDDFLVAPYQPVASIKPERRFRGAVADGNPLRLEEEGGVMYKISRKDIRELTKKDLAKLYTTDGALIEALHEVLGEYASVGQYMAEKKLDAFRTKAGQIVRKVSLNSGPVSNYYRKNISDTNYSILGMPKYYCVEVYKNAKGKTKIWGLRYVDMLRKDKKLYLKENVLPADYKSHVCYLYAGDYITVTKKGTCIFEGVYRSVEALKLNRLSGKIKNHSEISQFSVGGDAEVVKRNIDLSGQLGSAIDETKEGFPCFAPLSSKKENG